MRNIEERNEDKKKKKKKEDEEIWKSVINVEEQNK